jgi:hypothetical protein
MAHARKACWARALVSSTLTSSASSGRRRLDVSRRARRVRFPYGPQGRIRLVAYGASFEPWLGASPREFDSHILRQHDPGGFA